MPLIIISTSLLIIASVYIRKAIKAAPVKYSDEKRFIDAVSYEERFSDIFETSDKQPQFHNIRLYSNSTLSDQPNTSAI